eukprot:15468775-Alexandrium_andersonii.AAC.1
MCACVKESGASNCILAETMAVDPSEAPTRGKYVLSQFGPLRVRGRTAFANTKLLRVVGASGNRVFAI